MKNQTTNLSIGLLANGSHSLKRGYEMWSQWKQTEDAWLLKESVIWIHHGIELVLKQLLVQSNEFLVFQDVNKAVDRLAILRTRKGMQDAGVLDLFEHDDKVMSVGFRNLVTRTAVALSIKELNEHASLRKKIEQLTKYRNSMVHFSIELDIFKVSSLLSEILDPLLTMLAKEVNDERFINIDIQKIRKLAQPVQEYIEGIRNEIVDAALLATEKALPPIGNRRAGIVWQALGSGLMISLISYLKKIRLLPQISDAHILIIVDRVDLANQLQVVLSKEGEINPILPENRYELASAMELKQQAIIISTIQKYNSDERKNNAECLLVGFSLNSKPEKLISTFPNAVHILFSSNPPNYFQNSYGPIIGKYGLQQAINDEIARPIRFEKMVTDGFSNVFLEDQDGLSEYFFDIRTSGHYLKSLAQKIVQHFESRQCEWKGKGAIVVRDISTALALYEHLVRIKPEWKGETDRNGLVKPISYTDNIHQRNLLVQRLQDQEDSLSLVVATGSFLVGYDNPLIHTIYVTCLVSHQLKYKLASLVCRDVQGKQEGLIVDFNDQDWRLDEYE